MKAKLQSARIGMNLEERTITNRRFVPGDQFEVEDVLYEFETEIVSSEAGAPGDGVTVEAAAVDKDVCTVESA
ncbi:MAG: hypothetical protein OXI66_06650 [Boseongicola sp.]|nr:hypothetical protein [Boseongicola sp.]MDE0345449.1 hypothetical protein [Boseongicola sp.]MXW85124.1 acyltransferase [Boseongicola sp. SB0667_bin_21]MYI70151.1 acyltransferase [Boseongicola sp. SB0673_bin_14]